MASLVKKIVTHQLFLLAVCIYSLPLHAGAQRPSADQASLSAKEAEKIEKKNAETKKTEIVQSAPSIGTFDISKGFSAVAEKALPAVVNVATTQVIEGKAGERGGEIPRFAPGSPFEEFFKEFFDQADKPRRVQSLGSGFIIGSDKKSAFIVTNYHVIADAKKISIFLNDKTELEATVHAYDERTDLALLKVNTESLPESKRQLPILEWGDSDGANVGNWVLAIGNPFGRGSTVTAGIISSKGRDIVTRARSKLSEYVDDFIQHSAQINMGNSGGCLLNTEGKVIGINTAIFSPSGGNVGIGFAIPSAVAKATINQLIEFGKTKRGWLGVRIQPVTEDIAESLGLGSTRGAIVGSVSPKGPAEKAKIEPGDVITEFDGKEVNESSRLSRIVGETPINKVVKVKLWRKGKELTVNVTIAEFEDNDQKEKITDDKKTESSKVVEVLGMQLAPLSPELKQRFGGGTKEAKGILVLKVDQSSTAAEIGIMKGDLIVEANQKEINTPKEFSDYVAEAKKAKRKNILLLVTRDGEPRFVPLKLESEDKVEAKSEDKAKSAPETSEKGSGKSAEKSAEKPHESGIPEHPANAPLTVPAA